jgi:hypothetical protein
MTGYQAGMPRARILPLAILATLALATPAQAAKSVKGKWKGTVHSGSISFKMKMTIKRTKVGSTAGTLSNPGSPCHGTLTVTSRHDGGLSLQYHEKNTAAGECTGNDKIFIKRKGAKLRWRAVAPSGQVGTAALRRA